MKKSLVGRSIQIICLCALMMLVVTGCGAVFNSQTDQAETRTDPMSDSTSKIEIDENESGDEPIESVNIIESTSFDLRVLKTNWSEADWQIPVLLSTYEEYVQYAQNVLTGCEWEADYQYTDEAAFLANYKKEWFDQKSLLMLPIIHPDWSYFHKVELIKSEQSGKLDIHVTANYQEEKIYPIESYWLIVMEVEKSDIENMTEMSVSLNESIDETQMVLESETHILDYTLVLETDDNTTKENVFTVQDKKELDAFYQQIKFTEEDTVSEFKNLLEGYQEEWFDENMLIFMRMTAPAHGYEYDLRLLLDTETGKIKMELFEHHDGMLYDAPASYLFVVEVSKTENGELDNIAGYDACRIYTGFN